MRRTVTIPAAGKELPIAMTGKSLVIESGPLYDLPEHVPTLGFDSGNNQFPLYPRSTYQAEHCFKNIILTGTEQSEGDEFILVTYNECLNSVLNINFLQQYTVDVRDTFQIAASDAVQSFSELQMINDQGRLPSAMYISASENDIRFSFGSDPGQGVDGLGHLLPSAATVQGILRIEGFRYIELFNFIAATATNSAQLNVTFEY